MDSNMALPIFNASPGFPAAVPFPQTITSTPHDQHSVSNQIGIALGVLSSTVPNQTISQVSNKSITAHANNGNRDGINGDLSDKEEGEVSDDVRPTATQAQRPKQSSIPMGPRATTKQHIRASAKSQAKIKKKNNTNSTVRDAYKRASPSNNQSRRQNKALQREVKSASNSIVVANRQLGQQSLESGPHAGPVSSLPEESLNNPISPPNSPQKEILAYSLPLPVQQDFVKHFIRAVYKSGYTFKEIIREVPHVNELWLKGIYNELGIPTTNPKTVRQPVADSATSQTLESAVAAPIEPLLQSPPEQGAVTTTSTKPTDVPTPALTREDYVARLQAARSKKVTQPRAPHISTPAASRSEEIILPVDVSALTAAIPTQIELDRVDAVERRKAKTELARRRMEEFKAKEFLKQMAVQNASIAHSKHGPEQSTEQFPADLPRSGESQGMEQDDMMSISSVDSVFEPTITVAKTRSATLPKGPHPTSRSIPPATIPGLFMSSASLPHLSAADQFQDSFMEATSSEYSTLQTRQSEVPQSRKRPAATDPSLVNDSEPSKRPFGQPRTQDEPNHMVLEFSDEESSDEEKDRSTSKIVVGKYFFEQLGSSGISRGSIASTPHAQTPLLVPEQQLLKERETEIQTMKRKIAEMELKAKVKAKIALSRSSTPLQDTNKDLTRNTNEHTILLLPQSQGIRVPLATNGSKLVSQSDAVGRKSPLLGQSTHTTQNGVEDRNGNTSEAGRLRDTLSSLNTATDAPTRSRLDILRAQIKELEDEALREEERQLNVASDALSKNPVVSGEENVTQDPASVVRANTGVEGVISQEPSHSSSALDNASPQGSPNIASFSIQTDGVAQNPGLQAEHDIQATCSATSSMSISSDEDDSNAGSASQDGHASLPKKDCETSVVDALSPGMEQDEVDEKGTAAEDDKTFAQAQTSVVESKRINVNADTPRQISASSLVGTSTESSTLFSVHPTTTSVEESEILMSESSGESDASHRHLSPQPGTPISDSQSMRSDEEDTLSTDYVMSGANVLPAAPNESAVENLDGPEMAQTEALNIGPGMSAGPSSGQLLEPKIHYETGGTNQESADEHSTEDAFMESGSSGEDYEPSNMNALASDNELASKIDNDGTMNTGDTSVVDDADLFGESEDDYEPPEAGSAADDSMSTTVADVVAPSKKEPISQQAFPKMTFGRVIEDGAPPTTQALNGEVLPKRATSASHHFEAYQSPLQIIRAFRKPSEVPIRSQQYDAMRVLCPAEGNGLERCDDLSAAHLQEYQHFRDMISPSGGK